MSAVVSVVAEPMELDPAVLEVELLGELDSMLVVFEAVDAWIVAGGVNSPAFDSALNA